MSASRWGVSAVVGTTGSTGSDGPPRPAPPGGTARASIQWQRAAYSDPAPPFGPSYDTRTRVRRTEFALEGWWPWGAPARQASGALPPPPPGNTSSLRLGLHAARLDVMSNALASPDVTLDELGAWAHAGRGWAPGRGLHLDLGAALRTDSHDLAAALSAFGAEHAFTANAAWTRVEYTGDVLSGQVAYRPRFTADLALGDASLAWSSSIDGAIGSGSSLELGAPSAGVHTITLTATDSDGYAGNASVSLLVEELDFLDGTVADPQIGLDGMLYVMNTGDYVAPSTLAIIDPQTLERTAVVGGFPPGSGHVHVSPGGVLFTSAFFTGTVAWDSGTQAFVRDASEPICAPLAGGGCRGAFAVHTAADGSLYQTFFGSPSEGLPPQIFHYAPETFELTDSIDSGQGPVGLVIRSFR